MGENHFEDMEVPFVVLDAQSSSVHGTMDPVELLLGKYDLWGRPNQYRIYHVQRNEVLTTKEFIFLPDDLYLAILVRNRDDNRLRIVWRHRTVWRRWVIRYDEVPDNFAEQYVGAYLFDNDNAEDRERFKPKETEDQKEKKKQESLQELMDRGKKAIPEKLLKELQESIEEHCRTLGKLSVAKLRQLVRTVTEASQIDQEIKDRILVGSKKWNKRALCNWLSHQGEVKIDKVPKRYLDPIYMHVMLDPVVLPNGTTMDRGSFEEIMNQPEPRNPYSREPLDPHHVPPPNLFAKNEIADFVKDHAIDTEGEVSEDA
jgi:hypothetical protein